MKNKPKNSGSKTRSYSLLKPKLSPKILIAPSILSANSLQLADEIAAVEELGADWHHLDVMDGHFVPNLTFGPPLIAALKAVARIPLDVHIMVSNPDARALDYVRAGADILVFHVEAALHAHRLCQVIQDAGARPGVAINPATPLETLVPLFPFVDVINVMSVNPGFGGQAFIPAAVGRISALAHLLVKHGVSDRVRIEVDGGINENTAQLVVDAGATILVAGSYIYGAKDRKKNIDLLKRISAR